MTKIKKGKLNNMGSALITGLVVGTVLLVLCFSLLAVAYSFFLSAKNNTSDIPERERLYSAAEAFEKELMALNFSTMGREGQTDVIVLNCIDSSGSEPTITPDADYSNFWNTFMANITEDFSQKHFGKDYAHYYNLTTVGSYKIVLEAYWTFTSIAMAEGAQSDILNMDGTILHCDFILYNNDGEVICKSGKVYRLKWGAGAGGGNTGQGISGNGVTLDLGGNNTIDIWFYASPEDYVASNVLYTIHLLSPKTSLYIKYDDSDGYYHIFSKFDSDPSKKIDITVSLPVVENLDYWYYNLTGGPENYFFNGDGTEADHNGVHENELCSNENDYRRQLIAKLLPQSGSGTGSGTGAPSGGGSGGSTNGTGNIITGNFWKWERVTNVTSGSAEGT